MKLSGNTIFITGGGSGIGLGLAEALHRLGNKVIIAGRRRSHLDAAIAANPGMEAVVLNITDPTSISRVAAKLVAEHPDLNVLINNAGIMQADAAAGRMDDAQMVAMIATNLMGPIRMTAPSARYPAVTRSSKTKARVCDRSRNRPSSAATWPELASSAIQAR
jgi:uncharacterized oxidoreductase